MVIDGVELWNCHFAYTIKRTQNIRKMLVKQFVTVNNNHPKFSAIRHLIAMENFSSPIIVGFVSSGKAAVAVHRLPIAQSHSHTYI